MQSMLSFEKYTISAGARPSPLSKIQLKEIENELRTFYPSLVLVPRFVKTEGDLDRSTSLRSLGQTDFFTKEIDQLQLQGLFRVAVHSAKDLSSSLAQGLKLVALTRGLDPSDSLVFREGESLESLKPGSKVATSSLRREEVVQSLRTDLTFVDIRGNINERLDYLWHRQVDALVVAEAALIRLGLIHLNRIKLPGETAPLQGRLAVIAREGDEEMEKLFKVIHVE
jgi:hydroxymethylbilane synthase